MSTRTTSKPVTIPAPTEAQARAAMTVYIESHLQAEAIHNTAKQEIERIKKEADDKARAFEDTKTLQETTLMRYAEAHPELFQKRQKSELYGGHKIGWQVSPPAVVLVRPTGEKKKQTWDGFVDACRRAGGWAMEFIRTKEEPDKESILVSHRTAVEHSQQTGDASNTTELTAYLARLGVQVAQEERFVIDLALQPETVQAA